MSNFFIGRVFDPPLLLSHIKSSKEFFLTRSLTTKLNMTVLPPDQGVHGVAPRVLLDTASIP